MNSENNKIKYYSFNVQNNNQSIDNILNEGFTGVDADYQSSELNSITINLNKELKFENQEPGYTSLQDIKNEYNDMMNATIIQEHNVTNSINEIFETMQANKNNEYDENEYSVKLEYVNIGEYDKRIINGFIDKVNDSNYLPSDIKLSKIE